MDYDFNVITKIKIKDVKDKFEAYQYLQDYLNAAYELSFSDDEDDDHYEYLNQQITCISEWI